MQGRTIAALLSASALVVVGTLGACDVNIFTEVPSGPGWGPGAAAGGSGGGEPLGGATAYPTWCAECHGTAQDPAPPPDRNGATDTTAPGVGAHQSHFHDIAWHLRVGCNQCHLVPNTAGVDPNVPTHLNDKSDITWGPIAREGTYDEETHTCSDVYCHGATLPPDDPALGVATIRTPVWNQVDGTQSACGLACHTQPPIDVNHTELDNDCDRAGCHSGEIGIYNAAEPDLSLWLLPDLHVDGTSNSD